MKKFHSYGPVDAEEHFCVERQELIQLCASQLIGNQKKGGHYFTIWAPRQTGKTWLIRQSVLQIKKLYADSCVVGDISMQGYALSNNDDPVTLFFKCFQKELGNELDLIIKDVNSWNQWLELFEKQRGLFKKPLILLIDEFDKLPQDIIDHVVSMFRHMYLSRDHYMLHGLALIGVRAVLGVDSKKGSPFNVQRSIHIPNLTVEEVQKMFDDYQAETGQKIDFQVVQQLYDITNGQPGLIGWFGELLTEKFNHDPDKRINMDLWDEVYAASLHIEHNNTIQNMIVKAKTEYKSAVLKLFNEANIDFSFNIDWCNYMYMHGLIIYEKIRHLKEIRYVCRFSSLYVQSCLYTVFTNEIAQSQSGQVMALDPLDFLEDVFEPPILNIPALLDRYKHYLKRLKDNGENPWANQPRRKSDFHFTEAVGHFHLYYWLKMVLNDICSVIPEFPTGNGKVDLHLVCEDKKGLIEVKSFANANKYKMAITQAASYAMQTMHDNVTIAMFAPFTDEAVLSQLTVSKIVDGVNVNVVAIGQG
ncbi:MAG: AAA-like domain-containing protein [Candidatus Magnetomorum sp.]|nr:AAA-like domain-containing protein [Candidatus Magnetomorum sp.]